MTGSWRKHVFFPCEMKCFCWTRVYGFGFSCKLHAGYKVLVKTVTPSPWPALRQLKKSESKRHYFYLPTQNAVAGKQSDNLICWNCRHIAIRFTNCIYSTATFLLHSLFHLYRGRLYKRLLSMAMRKKLLSLARDVRDIFLCGKDEKFTR